ncbi:MAG: hypothetical protein HUU57_07105 [Bdellovibrio sp.]|nr:hypothetical protein [Bdellovibrio sp.]
MKSVGQIRFMGHAGIAVQKDNFELLIDPWLWSSTLTKPVINGFVPPNQGMGFLPRDSGDQHSDFQPQLILLSGFEFTHSPFEEIAAWIATRPLCLALPEPDLNQGRLILAALKPQAFDRVDFRFCLAGQHFQKGPFTIQAHFHPHPQHLIWEVRCDDFKILYIPKTPYNRGPDPLVLDICYEPFAGAKPDFLFIECPGETKKIVGDKKIEIQEFLTTTPVQTARLVAHIQPRFVGLVGNSNPDPQKRTHDYHLPAHVIEEQFQWALYQLCPETKTIGLRSGQKFSIAKNDHELQTHLHLSIT